MKHVLIVSLVCVFILNVSLSYGQTIKSAKRKVGLLNQSRVGRRSDVYFEKFGGAAGLGPYYPSPNQKACASKSVMMSIPRVGRADSSIPKYDPSDLHEMETIMDFDVKNEPVDRIKFEHAGNDNDVSYPLYILLNRKIWSQPPTDE